MGGREERKGVAQIGNLQLFLSLFSAFLLYTHSYPLTPYIPSTSSYTLFPVFFCVSESLSLSRSLYIYPCMSLHSTPITCLPTYLTNKSRKKKMAEEKELTFQEIASHNTKKDLYMVIHDKVYDCASFVDEHPYVFCTPIANVV